MNIKQIIGGILIAVPAVIGYYFFVWVLLLIPSQHQPLIYTPAVVTTVLTLMFLVGFMIIGAEVNKKNGD